MKSILESRMFYNWRLAKRGGVYLVGSLVAALSTGLCVFAAARAGWRPGHDTPAPAWTVIGFVALVLIAGVCWWRFSRLQDEMFHRIQNYSYGWGAVFSMAVFVAWGLGNWAALLPPIDPLAPLLVFALAKSFFWTRATRTWL